MTVNTPYGKRTITEDDIREYMTWLKITRRQAINELAKRETFRGATEAIKAKKARRSR